jgi:DNA-binding response OmpR family regulator
MKNDFNILVVEDDETLLFAVTRALKKNGYQTLAAKNGREALRRFDETTPDLVVCDLVLPDTHGHKLAEEIQKKWQAEQPLFVFMSGVNNAEEEVTKGFELGAVDFISKPFRMNDLLHRVHTVFRIITLEREKHLIEEEQKQSRDNEISSWGKLSQEKAGFTKLIYEGNVFQDNNQPILSSLESAYRKIIGKAVDARIYKTTETHSPELAALGERFGFLKATPRDVIKIHKNVFKQLAQNQNPKKVSLYIEESRFILLELMGYLANYYRNRI